VSDIGFDVEVPPAWFTESQPTFKVGDRVRVRLIGECALKPTPGSYFERIGQIGHPEYENGVTGVVTAVGRRGDYLSDQGHTIDVDYDVPCRPLLPSGRWMGGGTYCAQELERLEPRP
jgi:hypothetical protein